MDRSTSALPKECSAPRRTQGYRSDSGDSGESSPEQPRGVRATRLGAGPNRRKPPPAPGRWERLIRPKAVANACGRALRRSATAGAALAVLGGVGGVAWAGYHFATTSPRFAIQTIEVRGNRHISADQVRAALPVQRGDNVFGVDLDVVGQLARSIPWVADAKVHRMLPNTIRIDLREHEPVAMADLGGLYLVDSTGHPFKRAAIEAGEASGFPVVTGISRARFTADPAEAEQLIGSALAALEAWRAEPERPAIGEIHISGFGAVTFRTYDAATAIQLGVLDPPPQPLRGSTAHSGETRIIDAKLPLRFQRFDTTWAKLAENERARTRVIHVDSHSDQVTVAFAKDQ